MAGEVVVVGLGAVGLDDQPPRGPAEVRDVRAAAHVDVGLLEAGFADEVEHEVFEQVACRREVGGQLAERA